MKYHQKASREVSSGVQCAMDNSNKKTDSMKFEEQDVKLRQSKGCEVHFWDKSKPMSLLPTVLHGV